MYPCLLAGRYMRIETFFMLTAAFVINIFAVVIFANFSETANADSIGLASAGQLISDTFGRTVGGWVTGGWVHGWAGGQLTSDLWAHGGWGGGACGVV